MKSDNDQVTPHLRYIVMKARYARFRCYKISCARNLISPKRAELQILTSKTLEIEMDVINICHTLINQ